MERVLSNIYRFDFPHRRKDRGISHTYLLVRKQGNILVCHCKNGSSVVDYYDEIDKLGGISLQLVPHFHDAKRGDLHQQLYDRFGSELCYHEAERPGIRTKTKCPAKEFGDEGLKLGSDLEAFYFPGHTPGMSVFRWNYRGKHFLFPSHVIGLKDGEWGVSFAPHIAPKQKQRFTEFANARVDYLARQNSVDGADTVHRLSDQEKTALQRVLCSQLQWKPDQSARLRVVTGFHPVLKVLSEGEQFDIDEVPAYGTCKIETIEGYLETANVAFFLNHSRAMAPGHPFLGKLRGFVEKGGGLWIGDARQKSKRSWLINSHPFPEVSLRTFHTSGRTKDVEQDLVSGDKHPATSLPKGKRFSTRAEVGLAFEPGKAGTVLLRNSAGEAVGVAGKVGKGRVAVTGFHHGLKTPVGEVERKLLPALVSWVGGKS